MSVVVRPAQEADFPTWCQLWDKYLEFYETSRGEAVKQATWRRILDPEVAMFALIAERDGQPVGLANFLFHPNFWEENDLCYLNDLFVEPDGRGSGTGAALIQAVVDAAAERGIQSVYWLTAEDNDRARRLYDRIASKSPFVHYAIGEV